MDDDLKRRLKAAARAEGVDLVGVGSRERLDLGPPSADLDYLMPGARSVVSLGVALDRGALRAFFAKEHWLGHGADRKRKEQTLYRAADRVADLLRQAGHQALTVDVNDIYRPEPGASSVVEMRHFHPDFSHRYGAMAAGLGRLGWSGNLMTPEFGAAVTLGTVITSAELTPDPLCADNPCDQCKLCTSVCPVEMISAKKSVEVTVAGLTEEIAAKRENECCWIGCADFHGLGPNGAWSNWSPYRVDYPLPADGDKLHARARALRSADPHTDLDADPNPYADYRKAVFDPAWPFTSTCGHCANICWADLEHRKQNRKLVRGSGVVVLGPDGERQVARGPVEEVDTPLGSRVGVINGEAAGEAATRPELNPRDRAALQAVQKQRKG